MPFDYVSVEEARQRKGLRMVVVGGVPSLWGEAAKGILHIKRIPWTAVRLTYDDEALVAWAGQRSGPVALLDDEPPVSDWQDILLLAERLAPDPALLPDTADAREQVLEISRGICASGGLGWMRRLQLVQASFLNQGGFPERVAKYLAAKYGYEADAADSYSSRVAEMLGGLSKRLHAQRTTGSRYYVGGSVTAADIYSACLMAMFRPLPAPQCTMNESTRQAFELVDAVTEEALDPILFEHRDWMYAQHLELPLSL